MNRPGISWSPQEAAALNEFLKSPLGSKLLLALMFRKPKLNLATTESAALSGAFIGGWEALFNELGAMRATPPEEPDVSKPGIDSTKD